METDFVNEYIAKLSAVTQDFMNKNVLLETKLALAEKVSRRLQEEVDSLKKEIQSLEESKAVKKSSKKEEEF